MLSKNLPTEELNKHISNIILVLNNGDTTDLVKACINLGLFLQKNFPGKVLDDIQKVLREFKDGESLPLPPLESLPPIMEGKIRAYQDIVNDEENSNLIPIMDALSKGIAVFGTLMGGSRVEEQLGKLQETSEEKINSVQKIIIAVVELEQATKELEQGRENYKSTERLLNYANQNLIKQAKRTDLTTDDKKTIITEIKSGIADLVKNWPR